MTDHSTARKSTSKAKRKDNAARVTAQSQATLGNAKARRVAATKEATAGPDLPQPDPSPDYVIKEHERRDIVARIAIVDTMALRRPSDALEPYTDPEGHLMRYAASCLTHPGIAQFFATQPQALKAAKTSQQWCAGCAQAFKGKPALISKQNPRARKAMP